MVWARHNHEFSYTPTEAARMLRVSPTRVRQLLQDGELDGERDEAGHWLIPARAVHERLERLRHESFLEAVGYDPSIVQAMQERVEVLREQVEMLRAELREAHAANRENRRIIAALTQRIPEVEAPGNQEAPREPPGGPENGATGQERAREPRPATGGAQEGVGRPWWRRFFSGRA
jgi:excisionase family DNA binding protein